MPFAAMGNACKQSNLKNHGKPGRKTSINAVKHREMSSNGVERRLKMNFRFEFLPIFIVFAVFKLT
jgi:hypothetical protein